MKKKKRYEIVNIWPKRVKRGSKRAPAMSAAAMRREKREALAAASVPAAGRRERVKKYEIVLLRRAARRRLAEGEGGEAQGVEAVVAGAAGVPVAALLPAADGEGWVYASWF
jgi:hypothetical protein